jgi:hypothetical protein
MISRKKAIGAFSRMLVVMPRSMPSFTAPAASSREAIFVFIFPCFLPPLEPAVVILSARSH